MIPYEKELKKKGYSNEQLKYLSKMLNQQIMDGEPDNWGPCCDRCSHRGQATKGCGLWCLEYLPRPENLKVEGDEG